MKRKDLLKAEKIVCSECSESKKTLLHRDGTYICKDCYEKLQSSEPDSPEMTARKNDIRNVLNQATFGEQEEKVSE